MKSWSARGIALPCFFASLCVLASDAGENRLPPSDELAARLEAVPVINGADRVPTVAALRALQPPACAPTCSVSRATLGYYAPGDGGEANYEWFPTSTATEDGGVVIKPAASNVAGRWIMATSHDATAAQFGAFNPNDGNQIANFAHFGAFVSGINRGTDFQGRVFLPAAKVAGPTYGTFDEAAVLSVQANQGRKPRAQVLGLQTDSALSGYADRDSVALYVDNIAQPPTTTVPSDGIRYSSTSVTGSAINASQVLPGMIIDTAPDPAIGGKKWSGRVTSVSGNTATVSAWFKVDGSHAEGMPPNSLAAYINPTTKIWAANFNITFTPQSLATDGTGLEIGVINDKSSAPQGVAFDAPSLGTYQGLTAFRARGGATTPWAVGMNCQDCDIGFNYVPPAVGYGTAHVGFNTSDGGNGFGFRDNNSNIGFEAVGTVPGGASFRVSDANRSAVNWQVDGSGIQYSIRKNLRVASTSTRLNPLDVVTLCSGSGAKTITLPTPAGNIGLVEEITNKGTGPCTLATPMGLIDTLPTVAVSTNNTTKLISDGQNWDITY